MSIKILLLRSNEEIITEAQELADPETKESIGFKLHKPFRLEIVSDEGEIVFNREKGYQLSWFPWAPLSKDKDFYLPGSHVVTVYNPLDALTTQYISAIDEERYDANFKKHEERFNLSYDENDLDEMFKEAEKIMNEDEETKPV